MGEFQLEEGITIHAAKQQVWRNIVLFINQRKWSPWLTLDSQCEIELTWEDGVEWTTERWNSTIIWSGERGVQSIEEYKSISYTINFSAPYSSRAESTIHIYEQAEWKIKVVWSMNSKLPLFLAFKKKSLTTRISRDYQRGLEMLKYLCETWNTPTHLAPEWISGTSESFAISLERTSWIEDIAKNMWEDFKTLWKFVATNKTWAHGARSYYIASDIQKNLYTYRSSIMLTRDEFIEIEDTMLSDGIEKHYYPSWKVYTLRMRGSYRFMENAWIAIFHHIRAKKLKHNTKMPSYEDYVNDPSKNPEEKYITDICLYIR